MAVLPIKPNRIQIVDVEFSTTVVKFENGSEQRFINFDTPIHTFKLIYQLLDAVEISTLSNFFTAHKGAGKSFQLENHLDGLTYTVRFKNDKLSWKYMNAFRAGCEVEVVTCR